MSAGEIVTLATSPDGRFTYRVAYAATTPVGRLNGALSVESTDGVALPATRDTRDEFDEVTEMVFGPDRLIAWMSADDNYGNQVFVGRLGDDGRILDAHQLASGSSSFGTGMSFDDAVLTVPSRDGSVAHDTTTDPFFVASSAQPVLVDRSAPLVESLVEVGADALPGAWFVGRTLSGSPACGASTVYADDPDGLRRILAAEIELDTVVDVLASDTVVTGGPDTAWASRAVVLATECPSAHEGQRLFWGIERVDYGDGGPRRELPLVVSAIEGGPFESMVELVVHRSTDGFDHVIALDVTVTALDGSTQTLRIAP